MRSLRFRLSALWILSLIASIAVGLLLIQFYQESITAQVERAEAMVAHGCDAIRDRYRFYTAGWNGTYPAGDNDRLRRGLAAAVSVALSNQPGVEGGVWQSGTGSLAYEFPTYAGTGRKTDLPLAERDHIGSVNGQAVAADQPILSKSTSRTQTLLVFACPLGGPIQGVTGWTMTRVDAAPGYARLRLGLGVLFVLLIVQSIGLTWVVISWSRRARRLERELGQNDAERLPRLSRTGDAELDRVVVALNAAGVRLEEARRRSTELSARVAAAERLAALGRMAAGLAHEIRNPMAAMRLKAENALAAGDASWRPVMRSVLTQIGRIDGLVTQLLTMTHRRDPVAVKVNVEQFLADCLADFRELADAHELTLATCGSVAGAEFDPDLVRQAVANLLLNAVQHTPPGGQVTLAAMATEKMLRFQVSDTGSGVTSAVRSSLFEPFVTGRADGTGLGLAVVRELAEAHGGEVRLTCPGGNGEQTVFELDVPWHAC